MESVSEIKFHCAKTYPSPISSFQLLKPSMLEKVWPQVRAMTNLTPAELIKLESPVWNAISLGCERLMLKHSMNKYLLLLVAPNEICSSLGYCVPGYSLCLSELCELLQHHCWDISPATVVPIDDHGQVQSCLSWKSCNWNIHIGTGEIFSSGK